MFLQHAFKSPLASPTRKLSSFVVTLVCLSCAALYLAASSTEAFQCFVCDSKNDIECMEKLPADSRLKPQDCHNITGAKYCIKTTNLYAGEFGTKRFCSAKDHGSRCNYVRQPTGDRSYRSCVLTCDSENCNGAKALIDRQVALYVATPLMLITYILMKIYIYNYQIL